jgi:lysophospholipase L1-like esterase
MKFTPKLALLIVLIVILLYFALQSFVFFRFTNESGRLSDQASAYEQNNLSGKTLLVIGDSTAVGVGATSATTSIAGRIGTDIPMLGIANLSLPGLRIESVVRTLQNVKDSQFDAILLQVGMSDILWFTSEEKLSIQIDAMLNRSKAIAGDVVWMSTGNVGAAPIFPFPVDAVLSMRAKKINTLFQDKAVKFGVTYINLYYSRSEDPFLKDRKLFFASDRLHPSTEGYRIWHKQLKERLEREGIVYE